MRNIKKKGVFYFYACNLFTDNAHLRPVREKYEGYGRIFCEKFILEPTGRYKVGMTESGHDYLHIESWYTTLEEIEVERYVTGTLSKLKRFFMCSPKRYLQIEKKTVPYTRSVWVPDHCINYKEVYTPTEETFTCGGLR